MADRVEALDGVGVHVHTDAAVDLVVFLAAVIDGVVPRELRVELAVIRALVRYDAGFAIKVRFDSGDKLFVPQRLNKKRTSRTAAFDERQHGVLLVSAAGQCLHTSANFAGSPPTARY